jgi:hypothetical protein|tara:strand:+ start:119 stop:256 length:138 start_codon:yes stop_codon:yes gene_type:complete
MASSLALLASVAFVSLRLAGLGADRVFLSPFFDDRGLPSFSVDEI